jgi:hypothetical protein
MRQDKKSSVNWKTNRQNLEKHFLRINSSIQVLEAELSKETIIEENRIKKTVN